MYLVKNYSQIIPPEVLIILQTFVLATSFQFSVIIAGNFYCLNFKLQCHCNLMLYRAWAACFTWLGLIISFRLHKQKLKKCPWDMLLPCCFEWVIFLADKGIIWAGIIWEDKDTFWADSGIIRAAFIWAGIIEKIQVFLSRYRYFLSCFYLSRYYW